MESKSTTFKSSTLFPNGFRSGAYTCALSRLDLTRIEIIVKTLQVSGMVWPVISFWMCTPCML